MAAERTVVHTPVNERTSFSARKFSPNLDVIGSGVRRSRTGFVFASIVLVLIGIILLILVISEPAPDVTTASAFAALISQSAVMGHLFELEKIAFDSPSGSRSILNKYNASAEYVESVLDPSFWIVTRQHFEAPISAKVLAMFATRESEASAWVSYPAALPLSDANGAAVVAMRYSGGDGGVVTGTLVDVASGCTEAEYDAAGFTEGAIAFANDLLPSPDCDFYAKAMLAQNKSAAAMVVYRSSPSVSLPSSRVRGGDWTPESVMVTIPCVGISHTLALNLKEGVEVQLSVASNITIATTFNIVAESIEGPEDSVLVVGAHLDGVPEGPGINDNGSGSAAVLEMALQFSRLPSFTAKHRLRFVWFGAEEVGLIGSRYYVREAQERGGNDLNNIFAMLNFDMLGSSNYARFIYDGSGCPNETITGCVIVQKQFENYFKQEGLEYEVIPFSKTGGSDYFPFVRAGRVAGSIATGAGGIKTALQRQKFGGLAETPFDPCYHGSCDSTANINTNGLHEMVGAASTIVFQIAMAENLEELDD